MENRSTYFVNLYKLSLLQSNTLLVIHTARKYSYDWRVAKAGRRQDRVRSARICEHNSRPGLRGPAFVVSSVKVLQSVQVQFWAPVHVHSNPAGWSPSDACQYGQWLYRVHQRSIWNYSQKVWYNSFSKISL